MLRSMNFFKKSSEANQRVYILHILIHTKKKRTHEIERDKANHNLQR